MTRSSVVFGIVAAGLAAGALAACLDVAEERARRDASVGRAEADGVSVEVEEGLAAVRPSGPGALRLWAGAPSLRVTLRAEESAPRFLSVTVENALADAALSASVLDASAPGGARELPLEVLPSPHPTERLARLELPAGATVRLALEASDASDAAPFRFAAFADVQEDVGRVQDIFRRMNEDPSIRFGVISGDLTRQGTPEELERFQREMKTLAFPCYATLGNHELGTRDDLFHEYFGRGNFSFAWKGARFTFLDSASATIDPLAQGWLDGWLKEGEESFHVVAMHIPPVDPEGTRNGSFASRAEAHALLAQLASGAVDLTIYGHVHSYYAYANAGIPAYITGGGGAIPERFDGIGRHYLAVDVDPRASTFQTAIVRID